jgi:exodeoxyribonuclease VII small subunit
MSSAENLTYKEAMAQLEQIVHKIENEEPDVDELSAMVQKASELMQFCRKKLKSTEEEINQTLEKLKE